MASSHHEVPTLPVVVPLAGLAVTVLLWQLHRRAALTVPRIMVAATMCVYGAGVVANTMLPIYLGDDGNHPSWRVFLNLTPLVNTELSDMVRNVVVFVPLGLLLPLIVGDVPARRVLLYGFLVSFTMEALQFANAVAGHGGHIADINDLLANTVGAIIGYGISWCVLLLPAADRLAGAATWPPPLHGETSSEPAHVEL
jgi:glycopeptide antibiotics resistance protein